MKLSPAWTAVISLVPVLVLITLLAINIGIFGSDAILGASQVALLASSGVCVLLASIFFKTPWKAFEAAIATTSPTSPAQRSSSSLSAASPVPGR